MTAISLLTTCIVVCDRYAGAVPNPIPKGWSTYINSKYDFDVCYPPLLAAEPGTQAGDGQRFIGPDGGALSVTWRPGTAGDTLNRTLAEEVSGVGALSVVSYTAGSEDWGVRSGRQENKIFYIKVIKRDDGYLVMEVIYQKQDAVAWNAMVRHFAACFESSRPR